MEKHNHVQSLHHSALRDTGAMLETANKIAFVARGVKHSVQPKSFNCNVATIAVALVIACVAKCL